MFDSFWTMFTEQLSQNQFLSGGAILASFGIVLAYLRRVPQYVFNWVRRRLVIRVDILDRDEAFGWIIQWLAQHPYKKRCRLVSVKTTHNKGNNNEVIKEEAKKITLSPAPGPHFFFYKRRLVILRRSRQEGGDLKGGLLGIQEKFDITIFSRNTKLVNQLLEEAQKIANPFDRGIIKIYRADWATWILARKQPVRNLNSVVLKGNHKEELLADIKEFHRSESWYTKNGVPYRRGYLLYGPPGNGKSSTVTAIASELGLNVCVLTLSTKAMSDETLLTLCEDVPKSSLILLEDIDCATTKRETSEETVTLSGLLNALDGVVATEGRIMFMTTNYREKLDPALIRPGRCDVEILLDYATKSQAERLFLNFYPKYPQVAEKFADKGVGKSMAELQGLLIKHKNDPLKIITEM